MLTTFTRSKLLSTHISLNIDFFTNESLLEKPLRKSDTFWWSLSKRFSPGWDGQRRNKLCFRLGKTAKTQLGEKLPKVALIHPIQLWTMLCSASCIATSCTVLWWWNGELLVEEVWWRRVVESSFVISPLMVLGQLLTPASGEQRWKNAKEMSAC